MAGLLLCAVFAASQQVRAAEETVVLTEKQIDGIVATCQDSHYQLQRLHASDALIRVNIGQEYANLSSRLMAPLNSRIALNGLDGVELAQITVDYNQALKDFQASYLTYEAKMSAAIRTDCRRDPVRYYSHIIEARRLRAAVNDAVQDMNDKIGQYQKVFDEFKRTMAGEVNK